MLNVLEKTTKTIGVNDNTRENNVLRKNTRANDPVIIDGNLQQDDGKVNYLFHKVIKTGVCYEETNTRICKANQASAILKPVWRVTKLNVHAKMKIFWSNELSVMICEAEYWKTTVSIEVN